VKPLFLIAAEGFASAKPTHPGRMGEQQAKLATSRNKVLAVKLQGYSIAQYLQCVCEH